MPPDMKAVLYTSAYVPAEWIDAHGLQPVRLMPDREANILPVLNREGVCPFLRAFISEVLVYRDAAAVVMTTVCDQMRRGFDIVTCASRTPTFLLNIPHTLQSPAARRLYADELHRLGGFLMNLGGTSPSPEQLAQVMLRHKNGWQRQGAALPMANVAEGKAIGKLRLPLPPQLSVPVALVGPSLRKQDLGIFDIVHECGGCIALDATETGERGLCRPFDCRAVKDDPFLELADAYLNGIVDVFSRPNDSFYEWLAQRLKQRDIRAIVLHRYIWCDLWHVEAERLKNRMGLPVLDLDVADNESSAESRIRGRIEAFMEMLT